MSDTNDYFDPYNPGNLPRDDDDRRTEKRAIQSGDVSNVAADRLRHHIERVERLEEEKKTISDDIKDVYGEAKAEGYDPKAMRAIVKLRKEDPEKRAEREAVLDTYLAALGMI